MKWRSLQSEFVNESFPEWNRLEIYHTNKTLIKYIFKMLLRFNDGLHIQAKYAWDEQLT